MTKTSHKKNRPFDFKLINLVEPHPILYLRQVPGMSTYDIMKAKSNLWQQISAEMGFPVQFCLNRWNNLRGQFQKELKHCNELCPKSGVIRGSTWPYLQRLQFLESCVQANKPKKEKAKKRKIKEVEEEEEEEEDESVWKSEQESVQEYKIEEITDTMDDGNVIEEEYMTHDDMIIEEIAEEIVGTEIVEQQPEEEFGTNDTLENYNQMQSILSNFDIDTLQVIEKRLTAFLCKCQLRALSEQSIDDLYV